jgi:hypothetical protein
MNKRIKLDFNTEQHQADILKFEEAVQIVDSVNLEFKKIDSSIDLEQLLTAKSVFEFCVDSYWALHSQQFPPSVEPHKALSLTSFNTNTVEVGVQKLRGLKAVFKVENNKLTSAIDIEKHTTYLHPNKVEEFTIINKILTDIKKLNPHSGYCWHIAKAIGTEKVRVLGMEPILNISYFAS